MGRTCPIDVSVKKRLRRGQKKKRNPEKGEETKWPKQKKHFEEGKVVKTRRRGREGLRRLPEELKAWGKVNEKGGKNAGEVARTHTKILANEKGHDRKKRKYFLGPVHQNSKSHTAHEKPNPIGRKAKRASVKMPGSERKKRNA